MCWPCRFTEVVKKFVEDNADNGKSFLQKKKRKKKEKKKEEKTCLALLQNKAHTP